MTDNRWIHLRVWLAPLALLACLTSNSQAAAIRMAVMGDSISAGASGNWVGQLSKTFPGAITFFNSAKGGATTDTVISGQLNTVKAQATNGQIDNSTLIIGGNNFLSTAALAGILGGNPTPYINNYVNDVKLIIDTIALAGPNVRQVFGNMPDVTVTPLVQSYAAAADDPAAALAMLSAAIQQANAQANAYALSHNVVVIDLYSASHLFGTIAPYTLAGHTFTTAFAGDGFHPAGWVQGLLANMVDTAYNLQWQQGLPLLSDQQIVANQGFTPTGPTSYTNVTPYILLPVPEPATWTLAITGSLIVSSAWRSRSRTTKR